jgi:hypothetical protein
MYNAPVVWVVYWISTVPPLLEGEPSTSL